MGDVVVVSVGGSLIVPDEIDIKFLKELREIILKQVWKGKKFIVIAGGGKTCRNYQKAARKVTNLNNNELDWLGIASTKLNAFLLKTVFGNLASPDIIQDPTQKIKFTNKILVASGWKPGWSTDYDAVLLAKNVNSNKVVNLSNIDYVYDKDPKKFSDAKPIKELTWSEFRKLLPKKWDPGLNTPFDPVASKEADKSMIEVAIMNKLTNLEAYLEGKPFTGTRIR